MLKLRRNEPAECVVAAALEVSICNRPHTTVAAHAGVGDCLQQSAAARRPSKAVRLLGHVEEAGQLHR